jgi:hypothetical protein
MLTLIFIVSIISFVFIFLVHYLLNFFKTTLTVPKMKDLVNSPNEKYKSIYETIQNQNNTNSGYSEIDLLPIDNTNNQSDDMKNELKSFLKRQLNSDY